VERLLETFPGTTQVRLLGLDQAADKEIWEYARNNDFVIVTKDSDFHEFSILYGPPPKVMWLKIGNSTTNAVAQRLRAAVCRGVGAATPPRLPPAPKDSRRGRRSHEDRQRSVEVWEGRPRRDCHRHQCIRAEVDAPTKAGSGL